MPLQCQYLLSYVFPEIETGQLYKCPYKPLLMVDHIYILYSIVYTGHCHLAEYGTDIDLFQAYGAWTVRRIYAWFYCQHLL